MENPKISSGLIIEQLLYNNFDYSRDVGFKPTKPPTIVQERTFTRLLHSTIILTIYQFILSIRGRSRGSRFPRSPPPTHNPSQWQICFLCRFQKRKYAVSYLRLVTATRISSQSLTELVVVWFIGWNSTVELNVNLYFHRKRFSRLWAFDTLPKSTFFNITPTIGLLGLSLIVLELSQCSMTSECLNKNRKMYLNSSSVCHCAHSLRGHTFIKNNVD